MSPTTASPALPPGTRVRVVLPEDWQALAALRSVPDLRALAGVTGTVVGTRDGWPLVFCDDHRSALPLPPWALEVVADPRDAVLLALADWFESPSRGLRDEARDALLTRLGVPLEPKWADRESENDAAAAALRALVSRG